MDYYYYYINYHHYCYTTDCLSASKITINPSLFKVSENNYTDLFKAINLSLFKVSKNDCPGLFKVSKLTISLNLNKIITPDLFKASEITINLNLFKASKITTNTDLFKVSKITINLDLFKVSKITMLLANKPIQKSIHLRSIYLRSNRLASNYKKKVFVSYGIRMPNLSLNEWEQITKMRCIKGYKNMSKEKLLSIFSESESAKSLNNAKIKKIREDFNELKDRFLKPKIKEIRKNLYEIEKKIFLNQK